MAPAAAERREKFLGVLYALSSFALWGFNPIYFKAVAAVPSLEVLGHRIVWSVPFLALLVTAARGWGEVARAVRSRRIFAILLLTGAILASNWLLYIYAVSSGQILESSIGYYINPLVNVLLGFLVLGERLRPLQWLAVALAAAGVLNLAIVNGVFPWLGLSLAVTFGFYGLLRKLARVESAPGLFVETLILSPAALTYLTWLGLAGVGHFAAVSIGFDLLLMLAGPVTAVPLLLFASGVRRIDLATLGFCQYLSPTLQFLLAVLVYGEVFTPAHGVTFALIWIAVAIFSFEAFARARRARYIERQGA